MTQSHKFFPWNGVDGNFFWLQWQHTKPRICHCVCEITIRPCWAGMSFSGSLVFPSGPHNMIWEMENRAFRFEGGRCRRRAAINCAALLCCDRILAGHSAQANLGPLGDCSDDPFSYFGNQTLIFSIFFSPTPEKFMINDITS